MIKPLSLAINDSTNNHSGVASSLFAPIILRAIDAKDVYLYTCCISFCDVYYIPSCH